MQHRRISSRLFRALATLGACLVVNLGTAQAAATLTVVNVDGPGEGFNDPTPAAPVGGNTGTTRGEQRLIAFQHAADIWGATLDSAVEIKIQASFDPLTCTATGAVLGAAGAIQIFANFPNAEITDIWYHVALANKLAGEDLAPEETDPDPDDIVAFFNSNLNGNPACLGGRGFYLGLDNNHGTDIDLVVVLLHEFGHGLGFANFVNEAAGTRPLGLGDIFSEYTFDVTTEKLWNDMTAGAGSELQASAVNFRKVVWSGLHVTEAIPSVLSFGTPLLTVHAPASVANKYDVGGAAFGPPLSSPGVTGNVVAAVDPVDANGPTTLDGCSPLTNAAAVAGNIALVDRGTCGFTVKAFNAQNAGAIGVIVANVVAGSPITMGAAPVLPITIPAVNISLADGTALRAASGVNATIGVDLTVRAGTEKTTGLAHLNAPNPVAPGSSISHWDPVAFRNQLMEPAINADLTHSVLVPEDLTEREMTDIGWRSDFDGVPDGVDECIGSDPRTTVVIDGCDTRVGNDQSVLGSNGCKISDFMEECAETSSNHGRYVACVAVTAAALKRERSITILEAVKLVLAAVFADLP